MEFEHKQAYKMIETGVSLSLKIKDYEAISNIFFTLLAICLKLNDELMRLTA